MRDIDYTDPDGIIAAAIKWGMAAITVLSFATPVVAVGVYSYAGFTGSFKVPEHFGVITLIGCSIAFCISLAKVLPEP